MVFKAGNFRLVLLQLLLLAGVAGLSFAQLPGNEETPPVVPSPGQSHLPPNTRAIEGFVHDANGAPAKNAVVLLKDTKTLQVRSFVAEADGKYHFYGLSTDVNYQVRAENTDMTSPTKLISVFNSHERIKLNLKTENKRSTGSNTAGSTWS